MSIFQKKDLVWAKLMGHPWWPGIITDQCTEELNHLHFQVSFFPNYQYSWLPIKKIVKYDLENKQKYVKQAKRFGYIDRKQFTKSLKMANEWWRLIAKIKRQSQKIQKLQDDNDNEQKQSYQKYQQSEYYGELTTVFVKNSNIKISSIINEEEQANISKAQKATVVSTDTILQQEAQQSQDIMIMVNNVRYSNKNYKKKNKNKNKNKDKNKKIKKYRCSINDTRMLIRKLYNILKTKIQNTISNKTICQQFCINYIMKLGQQCDNNISTYSRIIRQAHNYNWIQILNQYNQQH